jgi:predicted ATP-grasp superfamily ATP-dependent carboligase
VKHFDMAMSTPRGTEAVAKARDLRRHSGSRVRRPLPVILLGGSIIAVSVARSVGTAHIPVWALGDAGSDMVNRSRFCTSFVDLGSGDGVQERWLDWLCNRQIGEAVVFPCCDDGLELVGRDRATLVEHGYLPIEANDDVMLAMLDKLKTYALARQADIETPRHFALKSLDQLDGALAESGVEFPCALKPLHSHLFARWYGSDQKAFVAQDRAELVKACAQIAAHQLQMMVTEIIPGPEDTYHSLHTYLNEDGEPLALLTKRKLRQNPVAFGMGTYHQTDWNEEVARVGLQFCRGVGILGMANPEFKRDARDGRLKLIECNHRFTMSNELVRRVGVNLPLLAYNRLLDRPVQQVSGYRQGVYLWAPGQDTRAFLEARRRGQMTFAQWVGSLLHPQHLALFDRSDPGPFLLAMARRLRRLTMRRFT